MTDRTPPSTPAPHRRRSAAARGVLCLAICALALAACRSDPEPERPQDADPVPGETVEGNAAPTTAMQLKSAAAKESADAAPEPDLTLPLPAVLAESDVALTPPTGDAAEKARLDLAAVLARVEKPDYLTPADPGDVVDLNAEAPSAAVKAYVHGLAAFREGQRFEAINNLEQARRLDPKSPQILRLLGQVYFAYRNEVKGAERLTEAVRIDPDDAESLYLLGRVAFHRQHWDEAIATLARSAEVDDASDQLDPGVPYERDYYLAQALLQQGYDTAAIPRAQSFLRLPARFVRTTRMYRELTVLDRQRGRVHQQVGDALCRLGRHAEAVDHYALVAGDEEQVVDPDLLTARRVYVALALDRPRTAEFTLVQRLANGEPTGPLLSLVPYVAEHGGRPDVFARIVRSIYEQTDRPAPLALAVAGMLQPTPAVEFLAEHLTQRPGDLDVYRYMVDSYGDERPSDVLPVTLALIRGEPDAARQYSDVLIRQDVDSRQWLSLIDALPPEQAQSAAAWYLRGAIHEAADRIEDAADAYDKALAADGDFMSPHMATIDLQLRLGRYDKALALIDRIEPPLDDSLRYARVRAYTGLGRYDEALESIDQLIAAQSRNADYRLLKAQVQSAKGDLSGAQATLWSILNFAQTNEDAYAALFNLYGDDRWEDPNQWINLLREVQRQIPNSRVARFYLAVYFVRSRQFAQAERPLKDILALDPGDTEALWLLVNSYTRSDRFDDAETLLMEQIRNRPEDLEPLRLLGAVAREQGTLPEYYPLAEKVLAEREPSYEGHIMLAQIYLDWGKPDKAVAALEQAVGLRGEVSMELRIDLARLLHRVGETDRALAVLEDAAKRHIADAPDLLYYKAMLEHDADRHDDAERTLLSVLEIDPSHAPANNDLGYFWAEQNKNLERALAMTRKAVEADKQEKGAYLDSLGWALYKLGRFDEAIKQFELARERADGSDPVILDHYGDALWRSNQRPRALQVWQEALRAAAGISSDEREDVAALRTALTDKIRAAIANENPPVAPLPGDPKPAAVNDAKPPDGE